MKKYILVKINKFIFWIQKEEYGLLDFQIIILYWLEFMELNKED